MVKKKQLLKDIIINVEMRHLKKAGCVNAMVE